MKNPYRPVLGNRVESVQGNVGLAQVRCHRTRIHIQHEKRAGRYGKRVQLARDLSHSLLRKRFVY